MKFTKLPIFDLRNETAEAITISFKPTDKEWLNYLAGQYLTLRLEIDGESVRRSYSLCSSPATDKLLSVTVKAVEGGKVSNYLKNNLKVGDMVEVMPPMGNFTLKTNPTHSFHYILIGAGSGITPIISILKTALANENKSKITLLYANRNENSIIFKNELELLQNKYPKQLTVIHTLTQPNNNWKGHTGRLEGKLAQKLLSEAIQSTPLQQQFYLCGPNEMITNMQQLLNLIGVPSKNIHRELFSAPPPDENDEEEIEYEVITQTVKVWLEGAPYDVVVEPHQTILDAVIAKDLDPPYACREGLCTTCRAKLKMGLVAMDEREGLSDEEIEDGFILTCQSHPLTADVTVEYG